MISPALHRLHPASDGYIGCTLRPDAEPPVHNPSVPLSQNIPCKNIFRFSFQLAVDPAGIAPLLHSSQTSGSPLSCTRLFSYHKNRSETAPVPGIPLPAEIEIHLHPDL